MAGFNSTIIAWRGRTARIRYGAVAGRRPQPRGSGSINAENPKDAGCVATLPLPPRLHRQRFLADRVGSASAFINSGTARCRGRLSADGFRSGGRSMLFISSREGYVHTRIAEMLQRPDNVRSRRKLRSADEKARTESRKGVHADFPQLSATTKPSAG